MVTLTIGTQVTKSNDGQVECTIFTILERLDTQRSRIREYLDKTADISEKIAIEKMILDIDYKITQINQKMAESSKRIMNYAIGFLNDHLKVQNQTQRYSTFVQKMAVTESPIKKIDKIISEDKRNLCSRQNGISN